jgi:hypothetical protein
VLLSGALAEVLQDGSGLLTLRLRSPLKRCRRLASASRARTARTMHVPGAHAEAIEAASAAGCETLAIDYGRRNLEQLFMQLTQRSLRD